ncbi:glycosyltransferase [Terasakiella sp. A23]|uniref:glycosyltransferase n=1 Tax=Terasakiella sp. FCG-A23 TaxID=3080561 RepID=UPI002955D1FD|nr:glycosyltransferase [Terasakiella sp. A23]MDV7338154.1 glycosyltransferase [Terasakiella sp. A23]
MIDISFVITVYNKENFLGPMLTSLGQQSGDFTREFIFVDDGSTDNSVAIIKEETKDWDNVHIIQQENMGVSGATNTGGFKAQGEFIKIVDADDVMTHFATRRMMELMREHKLDHLQAGWQLTDDLLTAFENTHDETGTVRMVQDPFKDFIRNGMGGSTSTMIRTQMFKEMGGCDETIFVQDFSIPLRVSYRGRMGLTDLLAVFGPREAEGRVLDASATVIHDLSATIQHFLRDNPDVPVKLQRLAFKRCAGRAWKWAKREQGKSMFCRDFFYYALSQLPIWYQTAPLIEKTLHTWDSEDVRRPKPRR